MGIIKIIHVRTKKSEFFRKFPNPIINNTSNMNVIFKTELRQSKGIMLHTHYVLRFLSPFGLVVHTIILMYHDVGA